MKDLKGMAEQISDEEIKFLRRYVRTDEGARNMIGSAIESNKALSASCEGKLRALYECYTAALEHLVQKLE